MSDHAEPLKKAAAGYRRAKVKAEQIVAGPREKLAAEVRAAYADGVKKADILRAIEYEWSRQWIDQLLKEPKPPSSKGAAAPKEES